MAVTRSRFTKDKPKDLLKSNLLPTRMTRSGNNSNPYAFADAGSLDTISRAPQAQPTFQAAPQSGGGRIAGIDFFPAAADAGSLDTISRISSLPTSTMPSRRPPSRRPAERQPSYTDYSFADMGSLDTISRRPDPSTVVDPAMAAADAGSLDTYQPWRNTTEIAGSVINLDDSPEEIAANIASAIYGTSPQGGSGGGGGGGGGGGSTLDKEAYAQAINDYIASIEGSGTDYGTLQTDLSDRYAGYGANLASIADAASARQQAAADRASAALAAIDPQAAFQFNVDPATIGGGAAENYLRSIGASTAGVEGLRGFEQSLLNQSLAGARQFSDAQQSALDIERAARQAAVPQMLLESENALNAQRMGAEMGLSESERAALEALLGRQSSEGQSLAERILNARLMAAQAGVPLA